MLILPLAGRFREYFVEVKAAQELNKQLCDNCYNYEYNGFVFMDELTERLSGEGKALFLDFCNAYGELMGDARLDSFIVGFRLVAKMIFDTFCSYDAPFESYLKD